MIAFQVFSGSKLKFYEVVTIVTSTSGGCYLWFFFSSAIISWCLRLSNNYASINCDRPFCECVGVIGGVAVAVVSALLVTQSLVWFADFSRTSARRCFELVVFPNVAFRHSGE